MQLNSFFGTCTARIMYGFGQSDTAIYGRGIHDKDTMFDKCRELLQQAGREGAATVIAIIDNQQTIAAEVLPELGFVCVQRDLAKHKHHEKKISTYVYTVCDADRVALDIPQNPWENPEVRRQREEAEAAERARAVEAARVETEARALRVERLGAVVEARHNGVDYNNLPAPRGRNRELEATALYTNMKNLLADKPETWKKCRRNLRVLFENHSWTFINGPQLGIGQDRQHWQGHTSANMDMAFDWEHTPQGHDFWGEINGLARGY